MRDILKRDRRWLAWLNYYFLQWFFVRLYEMTELRTGKHVKWGILYAKPMTGWIK